MGIIVFRIFIIGLIGGRIVESGGPDLALHLEEQGYDWVRKSTRNPQPDLSVRLRQK